jgi:hypothetical protein
MTSQVESSISGCGEIDNSVSQSLDKIWDCGCESKRLDQSQIPLSPLCSSFSSKVDRLSSIYGYRSSRALFVQIRTIFS